jgi:hypothetical protein
MKAIWVCSFFALAWGGCSADSTTLVEPLRAEQGSVALPLRAEANGIAYRLRAANFDVTGPESLTLHTDDAPDTLVLRHPLQVGDYQIELLDGWRLERQLGAGFEEVSASPLSPKLQSFSIAREQTTSVAYDFRTEQAVIDFNDGDLALSIGVQDSEFCGSGGTIERLDDGDPCTIDRCDAVAGVVHELAPDAGPDCQRCSAGAASQCCNCTGACQQCNNGTCSQLAAGQAGNCESGQVCNQQGSCVFNDVGLGQACNVQANNCSVGSCVGGTCQCSGSNPNACGGNRCVNFQTDGANCGACGVNCGALGCNGQGQCNCPAGQTFSAGSCRLNDGQQCTPNGGTQCLNGCTQWFSDADGDGFGNSTTAINRCGATPPGAGLVRQGGDCCDTDGDARPNQTDSFSRTRNGCGGGDFNCDNREDKTFRNVGGGSDRLSTNVAQTLNNVLSGFPSCEALSSPPCNPTSVTLIWPGGQPPPCGATGAQGTGAGSQCALSGGVCTGVRGFGVDVFCR